MSRFKRQSSRYTTEQIQNAIRDCFFKVGGLEYLERIANEDPRLFMRLLEKILPTVQESKVDVNVNVSYSEELAKMQSRLNSIRGLPKDVNPNKQHLTIDHKS